MTDFCVESTAIHEEYVEEFNSTYSPLIKRLPSTQFICVTSHPHLVIKRDNLKVVDIKEFTTTKFKKRFDHHGGFNEILQSTRFGLHVAYDIGYTNVIHLNTDITYVDDISEVKLSQHFKNIGEGIYYDMSGAVPVTSRIANGDAKTIHLAEYFSLTDNDLMRLPVGDEPVVMFNFSDRNYFMKFLEILEKICIETFKYPHFETGIGVEMSFASHLCGMKSVIDYTNIKEKYFDVNNQYLYTKCYEDRDPNTIR